jgi:AcrR family transcriptional regulator
MSYNEKQLQIIATAESLFASRGFEGTSVRDIAEAAGINIAMISYYFGSKEKLMEALFDQRTGHVRMRVESLLKDDSLNPFEKLNLLIDEHINKAIDLQLFYKIMVTEQLINKNSTITGAVSELKKRNISVVSELVEDGRKKGFFKDGIDVVMMMYTLIGTVSQTVMNQAFYREYYQQTETPDAEFKTFLKEKLSTHLKQVFKSILSHE